jgi:hypothetical protein
MVQVVGDPVTEEEAAEINIRTQQSNTLFGQKV